MLLSALKGESLKKYFPIPYCQRGQEYYHQSRVHNLKIVTNHNNTIFIDAHVRGGKPKSYDVRVYISGTIQKIHIRGICSCPMVINCKHAVAAILQALDQVSSPECTSSTVSSCANTNTPSINQTAIAPASALTRQQSL